LTLLYVNIVTCGFFYIQVHLFKVVNLDYNMRMYKIFVMVPVEDTDKIINAMADA